MDGWKLEDDISFGDGLFSGANWLFVLRCVHYVYHVREGFGRLKKGSFQKLFFGGRRG